MTDAERLAEKIGPRAMRWLADHFEEVKGPGSVEITCDHGPSGRLMRLAAKSTKMLDLSRD